MPRISTFYGIAIYMYYRDHGVSHFHAIYAEDEAVINVATCQIMEGSLPRRAAALVPEWCGQHRDELMENWRRAGAGEPLRAVPPLP